METIKDILNFCNVAVFHDYKNLGITKKIKTSAKMYNYFFLKTFPIVEF